MGSTSWLPSENKGHHERIRSHAGEMCVPHLGGASESHTFRTTARTAKVLGHEGSLRLKRSAASKSVHSSLECSEAVMRFNQF